jgi:hypothetical protein
LPSTFVDFDGACVYGCNFKQRGQKAMAIHNSALEEIPGLVPGTCGFDDVDRNIAAIINANAGGVKVPQKSVAKAS